MIFLLLILGVFTGVLAGIFGIGGGVLFTPALFFIFSCAGLEQPVAWTIGTSLFCTFSASLSSSIQQFNQGNSFLPEAAKVGFFGLFGVYTGKLVVTSSFYTEELFVSLFALLLFVVAWMFYQRGRSNMNMTNSNAVINWRNSVATGYGGGLVAALAGVGGGVVVVPAFNLWYNIDIAKAVSVSSFVVCIISLSGWLQFALFSGNRIGITEYTMGFVDFGTGLPLIAGAFAGGFLGVRAGKKITRGRRQVAFAILAVIIAVSMIYSLV